MRDDDGGEVGRPDPERGERGLDDRRDVEVPVSTRQGRLDRMRYPAVIPWYPAIPRVDLVDIVAKVGDVRAARVLELPVVIAMSSRIGLLSQTTGEE